MLTISMQVDREKQMLLYKHENEKAALNQEIENFGKILKEESYLYSWHLNTVHQLSLGAITVERSLSVSNGLPSNTLSSLTRLRKLASDINYFTDRCFIKGSMAGKEWLTVNMTFALASSMQDRI